MARILATCFIAWYTVISSHALPIYALCQHHGTLRVSARLLPSLRQGPCIRKPQPCLNTARLSAESGLSLRGYVGRGRDIKIPATIGEVDVAKARRLQPL